MIDLARRTIFEPEHELFRDSVRRFIAREIAPHLERWQEARIVDRTLWRACGEAGLLCPTVPETYGGPGLDFRANAIVQEEMSYAGFSSGIAVQSDIVADYILRYGSEKQKREILPRAIAGECVFAIAMTEPQAGSDLQGIRTTARRDGNHFIIDGAKTYITNGQHADLIVVVARTNPELRSKGISLLLVEADRAGFERGRNLDKIGQSASDVSEMFFHDVRVPEENLLGEEGCGFSYLMDQLPQERLSIAIGSQAGAQRAFDETIKFTRERSAFGKPVFDFQNSRFTLASLAADLQVGWSHLDWAIGRHVRNALTTAEASSAKLWHTEMQWRVVDAALQLHGGAGYMNEYPVARLWRDARIHRIYGGTSEIMKEVISRSL